MSRKESKVAPVQTENEMVAHNCQSSSSKSGVVESIDVDGLCFKDTTETQTTPRLITS